MGTKPTALNLLQESVDMFLKCGSGASAARELNIPRTTLLSRLEAAQRIGLTPSLNISKEAKTNAELRIRELENQVVGLKTQMIQSEREQLTDKQVREVIFGLPELSPQIPKWMPPKPISGTINPGTLCLLWSDFHWAEKIVREQVGGSNEFNLKIAHERIRTLVRKTIHLAKNCIVHETPIEGAVLMLGGDMFSGDIHDELAITNEITTPEAFVDLFGCLVWAIDQLVEAFASLKIVGVIGNHSRLSSQPRYKDSVKTSWDWLLYIMLEKHYTATEKRKVEFYIPGGIDCQITVAGTTYLLTHGNMIGSAGGDGLIGFIGPVMRGDFKITRQMQGISEGMSRMGAEAIMGDYDTLVMGHYHTYMPLPDVIVNGSFAGYNEYAYGKRFKFRPPVQSLWFTHPKFGKIWDTPIYLEE